MWKRDREKEREKRGDVSLMSWGVEGWRGVWAAEMCNYTYLEKYYHLCGRRAEASREEGQKTVFEMQGDAEMSEEGGQLTRIAFRGLGVGG